LRNIGFQGLRSMNGSRFGANWSPAEHAGLFKYPADEVSSDGMSASGQERFADDVAELSHIARPGVLLEAFASFRIDRGADRPQFGSVLLQEEGGQNLNVFNSLAERRQSDHGVIQPVIEVTAEELLLDSAFQVPMSRGDHTDIDLEALLSA